MDESLQLFSLHAFNEHYPLEDFMELSNTVVDYAGGIPLVLEVWGSFLNGKNNGEWRDATRKLKKIPHGEVQKIVRISFDSLDEKEKKLFLDIACFFVGESKNFAIQVLEACEFFPVIGFRRLEDLCLLKYDPGHVIVMHDILKQMGKEIIQQESDDPGKRSRLWDSKDALKVLKNCEGTETVEGLILLPNGKDIKVKAKVFQKMKRLRVLHLDHVLPSPGNKLLFRNFGYKHLSRNLVWLRWHHFDLSVLPSQLYLGNLVALDLSYSNIKRVWRGTMVLGKLKFLNLSYCHNLTTTPNFFGLPNLEELILDDCVRLQEVDKSIGHLHKLIILCLDNCQSLRKLPSEMANLKSLERLSISLSSWDQRRTLTKRSAGFIGLPPNFVQGFSCLKTLNMERCSIQLPNEIGNMISLTFLTICECKFDYLPESICSLTKLEILFIIDCRMSNLPSELGRLNRLRHLNLQGNNFCSLPESIGDLTKLRNLNLCRCERLQSLPKLSGGPCLIVAINSCPSLRRISLESITNSRIISCYMCPKLDMNCFVHEIGTSFFNYKHETTNSYYALKVPPLGVGNKHFIRCTFYVVYRIEIWHHSWSMKYTLRNKTKDISIDIDCSSMVFGPTSTEIRDHIIFEYRSFHVDKLELKEGDEIEISWTPDNNVVLKRWGVHVSYDTTDDHH
ncbi:disease resistance protein RPV1-like isoform X2 [Diospyros lotus]|uniref:disease resistance protein RPV1-like isoform X2 n=1 Tax=Diospyros lotus TaxID=55363 RepID=UPI00225A80C3|nr:disease resistance protein RPV1-like isoform X2 [Diospyros lotus]